MRGETESDKRDVVKDSGDKPEERMQESLSKHQFISEKEERMKIISDNFLLIWLSIRGDREKQIYKILLYCTKMEF